MKIRNSNPFLRFFRHLFSTSSIVVSMFTAGVAGAGTLYWDVNGETPGSGNAGGEWSDGASNWSTDASGSSLPTPWINGESAVFSAGTDGIGAWTVTLPGTIAAPSITFAQGGNQNIAGGTFNITPAGGLAINSSAAGNGGGNGKIISSQITGTGPLNLALNGDMSPTGGGSNTHFTFGSTTSTFTGAITVTSGLLDWTDNAALGNDSNKIILNGGGLIDPNRSRTTSRNIEVGPAGGTIRTWGSVNGFLNGTLTSTAATTLQRTDGGTLTINGDASGFTGQLINQRGTLRLGSTNWANTDFVQTDGGNVLRIITPGTTTIKSLTSDRDIVIELNCRLNIASGTYLGNSDPAVNAFWMQGPGKLTSSSGTLNVTNGLPGGNLVGIDQAIRVILEDFSAETPLSLVKNHNNSLVLDRVNLHTGGTTINGGRINSDNAGVFGTGPVTVNPGGQAALFAAGTFANNFVIAGPGVTEAAGTLGAIRFANNTISGSVTVAAGGARILGYGGATGTITGALKGSGPLEINDIVALANGAITITNTSEFTGALNVSNGTLNLGGPISGVTTVAAGATLNLNSGAQIDTPVFTTGANRTLRVRSGATVEGDILTDLDAGQIVSVDIGGAVTGNVVIDDTSSLTLNGGTIGGNLSTGFNEASNIVLNAFTPVAVTGDVTITGGATVSLVNNPTPGTPATILTYGGTFTGNLANLTLANSGSYRAAGAFVDTGSAITLTTGSATRTWQGGDATNPTFWNNTAANWAEGDKLFFNGDAVLFDDTATGSTTVAIQALVIPFSVTFNNTTLPYTVSGPGISGTTGITKNGTGALTLGGTASNFTGPVNINAGVLNLANGEALGFNSGITVASGARVNFNGHAPSNQGRHYTWMIAGDGGDGVGGVGAIHTTGGDIFANAGIQTLNLSGNAEIGGNNGRFDIGRSGGFFGAINGGGFTLTKVGTNQIVARGAASNITYVVNGGRLTFEDTDAAAGTNPIVVNNAGSQLGTFGLRTIANAVTLNTGTTLISVGGNTGTWSGPLTFNGAVGLQTDSNIILSGARTGSGTLTRSGGNTLVLGGTSTFTGNFVNNSGVLALPSDAALGAVGNSLELRNGSTLRGGDLAALGSLAINPARVVTSGGVGDVTFQAGAGNTISMGAFGGTTGIVKANDTGSLIFDGLVTTGARITANGGILRFNQGINSAAPLETGTDLVATISGTGGTIGSSEAAGGIRMWRSTLNLQHSGNLNIYDFQIQEGGSQLAVVNQTSGNVNVTADLRIGHWGGTTSVYNISAGSINQPDTVTNPTDEGQANLFVGIDGGGNLNISGTGVVNTTSLVMNGRGGNAPSIDTLNLTGGELNIGRWGIRNPGAALVNLGGGKLGARGADWSTTTPVTLTGTNGNVIIDTIDSVDDTTARNITLAGGLAGAGGFTKIGAGALVLGGTGPKTYLGEAVVEEGALIASGNLPGNLLIEPGASIAPGLTAIGTSVTTLTINDDATPEINGQMVVDLNGADQNIGGTSNDLIYIVGDVTFGPNSTILPRFFGGAVSSGSVYTVLQVDGARNGLPVVDPAIGNTVRFNFVVKPGEAPFEGDINLEISGSAGDLVWKGDGAANAWNVGSAENWTLDGNAAKFLNYDEVTFDDSGNNATPINLTGNLIPTALTVDATKDYIWTGTGNISSGTGLEKSGTGTLTILNNNSLGGTLTIAGGSVVVGDGGTAGSIGIGGAASIGDGASFVINRSDAQTLSRLVTGAGALVKDGAGTLTFNVGGQVALPGKVVVEEGTFQVTTGAFFTGSRLEGGGTLTVKPGATLLLQGAAHPLGGTNLNVGGLLFDLDGGTMTVNNEQYVQNLVMSGGVINGTNEIRATSVTNYLVTGSVPSLVSARVSANFGIANWNVQDVTGDASADLTISGPIVGGSGVTKTGPGTMLITGATSFTGALTVNEGDVSLSGTGDLEITRPLAGPGIVRNSFAGANLTINSLSPNFSGTLETPDKDVLIIGNYGGVGSVIEMTAGQTLTLGVPSTSYNLGVVAMNFADSAAEALDSTTAKGPLNTTFWNSSPAGAGNGTITNAVDSAGNPTPIRIEWASANTWGSGSGTDNENSKIVNGYLDDGGGNRVTISGLSSGGYNIYGLLGSDAGAQYTSRDFNVGGTWVYGGAAAVSKPAFGTWAGAGQQWVQLIPSTDTRGNFWKVENLTSPSLTIQGLGAGTGRGPLAGIIIEGSSVPLVIGESTVNSGVSLSEAGDLTIRAAGINNFTVNGPITADDDQGIIKTGARALLLNGVNTYTGDTTVAEGTLGGSGSLTSTVTVQSGASLNPGTGVGTLTTGAATLQAGSTFVVELDSGAGTADSLNANGSVTIAGNLSVVDLAVAPGTISPNAVFTVVSATGGVTGTFGNAPDGTVFTINGVDLTLKYTANSVTLSSPVVAGITYDEWAQQIPVGLRDRGQDADGDGFSNLQEFLFGTSPIAGNGSLMESARDGEFIYLRWNQLATGASYSLVESATLLPPWDTSTIVPQTNGPAVGDYQPMEAIVPLGTGPRFFSVEGEEN